MIAEGSTVGADAERTLHRLEAFSDIVIGFCIAEMGINLLVPQHPADFRAISTSVIGLNFTLLGSLVLMVYMQQILLRFFGQGNQVVDLMRMWMASYGLVYGLLDAMLWIGLRERWKTLSNVDRRRPGRVSQRHRLDRRTDRRGGVALCDSENRRSHHSDAFITKGRQVATIKKSPLTWKKGS